MAKNNEQKKFTSLFLLSTANLLAAFGGGTVLSQAINIAIDKQAFKLLEDAALIALMVGFIIAVIIIYLLDKIKTRWAQVSRKAGAYLSFIGAATAILVALAYHFHFGHSGAGSVARRDFDLIIFYILLSILFCLLYVPRSLRSDAAAGDKQRIGWVEFSYATGVVLGLISWTTVKLLLPKEGEAGNSGTKPFVIVLCLDAVFQIAAGLLDLASSRTAAALVPGNYKPTGSVKQKLHLRLGLNKVSNAVRSRIKTFPGSFYVNWRLYKFSIAVVALTVGTQMVAFKFRLALGESLGLLIVGGFYFGAALSALLYGTTKTRLQFPRKASYVSSFGSIVVRLGKQRRRIPLLLLSGLIALLLLLAVSGNAYRLISMCPESRMECLAKEGCTNINEKYCPVESYVAQVLFVLAITVAAFLYEWMFLSIINLIWKEAKAKGRDGYVAYTYGLMGVGAALAVLVISLFQVYIPGHLCWAVTLVGCLVITNFAIGARRKRRVTAPAVNLLRSAKPFSGSRQ